MEKQTDIEVQLKCKATSDPLQADYDGSHISPLNLSTSVTTDWAKLTNRERSLLLSEKFNCAFCSANYSCKKTLAKHVQCKHIQIQLANNERISVTGGRAARGKKKFSGNAKLRYSKQKHCSEPNVECIYTEGKDYECKVCFKEFAHRSSRNRHLVTHHSGVKDHKCDYCRKVFSVKETLKKHILIHTGEKKYECFVCNKYFAKSGNRNKHLLIHSGDKKHVCVVCRKGFTDKSNLGKHMAVHKDVNFVTGEKQFGEIYLPGVTDRLQVNHTAF